MRRHFGGERKSQVGHLRRITAIGEAKRAKANGGEDRADDETAG